MLIYDYQYFIYDSKHIAAHFFEIFWKKLLIFASPFNLSIIRMIESTFNGGNELVNSYVGELSDLRHDFNFSMLSSIISTLMRIESFK